MTATLPELEAPCPHCGHQSAVHVKGCGKTGWPIYDRVWRDATGACGERDCPCPGRHVSPQAYATAKAAA